LAVCDRRVAAEERISDRSAAQIAIHISTVLISEKLLKKFRGTGYV